MFRIAPRAHVLGLAFAVALASVRVPVAHATITPDAATVVARYLAAAGGADVARAVATTHIKAKLTAFGLEGSTEIWSQAPDHRATRTLVGPFKLLNGYDGRVAWRTDPTGKASVLDGKDLDDAKADAYFENERWLQADQGGGVVAVVKDPEAGKDYVVLEVTPPAGNPRRYWFNAKTGLVDKAVGKQDRETITDEYSDYRFAPAPAAGAPRLVAYTQITRVSGMPANDVKVTIEEIETNAAIDEAVFQVPSQQADVVKYLGTPGSAVLPFQYLGRHVWLRASVNGAPPADFIFDTGASLTVIDSSYAAKIGLERQGALQGQGAGSTGAAALSSIRTLRVEGPDGDGVEMSGQSIAILSVNPILAPFFWRDCAGIIGYDFITRFVNTIDFDHATLRLQDPKTFQYAGRGTAIPMKLAGTVPLITMKIDDQYDGEFRLDVGSSSTVDLHGPFVNRNHLRDKAGKSLDVMSGGFGGTFSSRLTRMKKIAIGPYSWTEPMVSLSGATTGALASEDYAGNVGNQILERFVVTLDYERKTVYLEPGARYGRRDSFSRSGVQLGKYGETLKAMQVLAGSPAAKAGVKESDAVTAIDGKPAASWSFEDLRQIFEDRPAGTKVTLELDRGGKKKKVTLKLADLL